ncbi:hypothetical protein JZ751_021648 [Albula glossodonta]|uniref:Uncharacterized protein n=1 Tax=Albula glossodonta TaxID=121402 RepID=A0A8T2NRP3_9TELE|nr:hypothetical protein JZ751_021648 [Albula glossodonta]
MVEKTIRKGERENDVHEAIHPVADLEEQVLPLPLSRGAERGPDQPGDAGDEEEGAQNDGSDLDLLDHCERDGLPLDEHREEEEGIKGMITVHRSSLSSLLLLGGCRVLWLLLSA